MGLLRDMKKKTEKAENGDAASEFWEAWLNSDELQRIALVRSLNVFELIKEPMERRAFENLVNSYLADLHNYMVTKVPVRIDNIFAGDNKYGRKPTEPEPELSQVQP
jgi:hypothetical protein